MSARRRRGDESGVATIEFLGVLPLVILIAGAIFQLFLMGYAAVEAESSARLAARELSKGTDESAAEARGESQASSFFDVAVNAGSGSGSGDGEPAAGGSAESSVNAEATVTVPFLGFGVEMFDIEITRHAVMPAPHERGF